jgi:hypothetical protein
VGRNQARLGATGAETDLGPLSPLAVNDSLEVVGADGGHAALWAAVHETDLNTLVQGSGWVLQTAVDINATPHERDRLQVA